jgi:hypothetical protein
VAEKIFEPDLVGFGRVNHERQLTPGFLDTEILDDEKNVFRLSLKSDGQVQLSGFETEVEAI